MKKSHSLLNQDAEIIVKNLAIANNFITRFKGLMGTKQLPKDNGLLISNCHQVHTHFMRYPLDVVFLNKDMYVIDIVHSLKPWRISRYYKEAYFALELPAERSKTCIKVSEQLKLRVNQTIN